MRELYKAVETSADLTLTDDMDLIIVDTTQNQVTLMLPVSLQGHQFRVKRNVNDHDSNTILIQSDSPDTQQFDVDGDNGYNIGLNPFYDFIQQGTKVYVC
jgi:hypothetical protein